MLKVGLNILKMLKMKLTLFNLVSNGIGVCFSAGILPQHLSYDTNV